MTTTARTHNRNLELAWLARACLACLFTVLVAEGSARVVLGLFPTPHCYDAARNPNFRRGWTAFTKPRHRGPDDRLIVVISNSQGFLRESGNPSLAYPARLRSLLDAADPRHRHIVANWSVPGGSGPEMVVLAARAAQHHPDLVLLVAYAPNFASPLAERPLSFDISDVNQLAYRAEVRSRLSPWFLRHYQLHDPVNWLSAHSGLVGIRNSFIEQRLDRWRWIQELPTPTTPELPILVGPWSATADRLLLEFRRALRTTRPTARLLVINMPLNTTLSARSPQVTALDEHARSVFADDPGVRVLDASHAITSRWFYRGTHMRPPGHERFARWLLPHLRQALARGPS